MIMRNRSDAAVGIQRFQFFIFQVIKTVRKRGKQVQQSFFFPADQPSSHRMTGWCLRMISRNDCNTASSRPSTSHFIKSTLGKSRNNSSPNTFFTFSDSTYSRKVLLLDYPGIGKFFHIVYSGNTHFHKFRFTTHRIMDKG